MTRACLETFRCVYLFKSVISRLEFIVSKLIFLSSDDLFVVATFVLNRFGAKL